MMIMIITLTIIYQAPIMYFTDIIPNIPNDPKDIISIGASLVAQWLRTRLPTQGTWV